MPGLGAAAVVFDENGRLLLVRENYGRRRYGFPGGAVEPGETPLDAVVRETREETGCAAEIDHLIGLYQLESGLLVHVFRCRIIDGVAAVPETNEIAELDWYDTDALPEPLTNVLHHALPHALGGRRGVVRLELPRLN